MSNSNTFDDFSFMHHAPRFGHSNNISLLASQDADRNSDYVRGLIAFSVFMLSFFLLWALALVYCKYKGLGYFGCLAGRVTHRGDVDSQRRAGKIRQVIRILFLMSCTGVLVGCGLVVGYGLPDLQKSAMEIMNLNGDLQLAIFEGISAVSSADDVRERLQSRSIDQYADLNEYCSNNKTNSDVLFSIQNNQTSLEKFSNVTDAVQNYLETTEVESLKNELNVVLEKSIKLDNYLQLYDENDWIPKMFTLLIANIVLFLIGSVVSSWLNFQIPALSAMMIYVLIPAFALLVTFAWITAIFFSAMSIMNADFCVGPTGSGGPEMTVQNALLEYGMGEDDLMYQSFLFYKNDCNGTEPWEPIVAQFQQLQDEMSAAEGLIEEFDEIGVENLTAACGTDFLPVITEVNNIQNDFQRLVASFEQGVELARCGRVNPLYDSLFRGVTCRETLIGFSWMFVSFLLMVLSGFLIVTLRSGLYSFKYISNEEEEEDIDFDIDESIGSDWDTFDKEKNFCDIPNVDTKITYSQSSDSDRVSPLSIHRGKENCHEMEPLSPTVEYLNEEQNYVSGDKRQSVYPYK